MRRSAYPASDARSEASYTDLSRYTDLSPTTEISCNQIASPSSPRRPSPPPAGSPRQRRNPQATPEHLLAVLLEQDGGIVPSVLRKLGVAPRPVRAPAQRRARRPADDGRGRRVSGQPSSELVQVLRAAEHEMRELKDEYVSTEHLLLSLAGHGSKAGDALRARRRDARSSCSQALAEVRGAQARDRPDPEDKIQALEKFGVDLTERAADGRARPGHRPRRRDPPRHPGAQPPHEEQPRADRRARRRQDRDRRGPRPARSSPATCPSRCATAASSRSTSAR